MPPNEPDRQRAARPWRIAVLAGGLLLTVTFNMPFSESRWQSVPASRLAHLIADTRARPLPNRVLQICLCLQAHLLGLLAAAAAAARLLGRPGWARVGAWGIAALLTLSALAWIIWLASELLPQGLFAHPANWKPMIAGFGGPALLLIYLAFAARLGNLAFLCFTFPVAALNPCLLLAHALDGGMVGAWLACLGSVALLAATIGEAAVLTGQPVVRTIWWLTSCRLRPPRTRSETCPACGYLLFGLTKQRCPECGQPFTFEELGVSPEELGFRTTEDA